MKLFIYIYATTLLFCNSLFSQTLLNDDFQSQKNHWYWRADGNQNIPIVSEGLLHLHLENAIDSEYCNTEIYNPDKICSPGTQVRIRLKASPIHLGSRGWGFWDGKLDLFSLIFDYDVAWVMQQSSQRTGNEYNWFLFGVDGDTLTNRLTYNLNGVIDETIWHTYKIIWDINKVTFFVDDVFYFEAYAHLPDEEMRVDIWADNRVLNLNNPLEQWHTNAEISEMLVDFVEVTGTNGPEISRNTEGSIVYWESPNTYPNGDLNHLWRSISLNSNSESEALIFLTGSAEKYSQEDDDLKIIFNNNDFGYDNNNSLDGNSLSGDSKSVVLPVNLKQGTNILDIYTDVTPFIRDIIVLNKPNGKTIFSKHYNEINPMNDELWKTIEFNSEEEAELTILISGAADEDEGLRFEFDDIQYGWTFDKSILGDSLKGFPNTVAISTVVSAGIHKLKIFGKGDAKLLSIAAYSSGNLTNIELPKIENNFSLSAYPNPFNASTKINYHLKRQADVKLKIYDSLGKEIVRLVDGFKQAGNYTIEWNAQNVSSGIYFCIFEVNDFLKTQKLLLLK